MRFRVFRAVFFFSWGMQFYLRKIQSDKKDMESANGTGELWVEVFNWKCHKMLGTMTIILNAAVNVSC